MSISRLVIVGAGSIGCELAERLAAQYQVLLLDVREANLARYGTPLHRFDDNVAAAESEGLVLVRGDGTSRLMLKSLFSEKFNCALVAVTGHDEVNLEAGRLARSVGFDPVVAVQHDSSYTVQYREAKITAIARSVLLADHLERSLRHKGAVVPFGIGLGQGELLEVRLMRTSPVLGRPLRRLAPQRWRVAAIFRDEQLVVPTGDTILKLDDRVLLVGAPDMLASVAEYLRLGRPQFPRPYGVNVMTLEFGGPDEALLQEAQGLAGGSCACNVVRGIPDAENSTVQEDIDLLPAPEIDRKIACRTFRLPAFDDPSFSVSLAGQHPGVFLVRPMRRSRLARILGIRGRDSGFCDRLAAPVLFARGTFPYRRILLPISDSDLMIRSAEMAIDVTRQKKASLTAVKVNLPRYISGLSEEANHREVIPIRQLCELYDVQLDYRHRQGNPIEHLLAEATNHDLVVMARRVSRRDTYFEPDVALRVARNAPCSVLVLTVRPEE